MICPNNNCKHENEEPAKSTKVREGSTIEDMELVYVCPKCKTESFAFVDCEDFIVTPK